MSRLRAAYTYVAINTFVMMFQLALLFGAPWGRFTQGGLYEGSLPALARVTAFVSAALLMLFSLSVLALHNRGPLKRISRRKKKVLRVLTLAYAVLAVMANIATPSEAERIVWAPIAAALLVALLLAQPSRDSTR